MKKIVSLVVIIMMISCKSKAVLAESIATNIIESDKIIQSHYNNKFEFSTLYIKANAKYEDENNSQNVTAEIKIKKDEKILVSIRFLGITMAKALITPTKVQYYEKLGGKYFEGDYASLSQWLGTDLDFNKVQNLLIGQALDNLNDSKYSATIIDKLYKLDDIKDSSTKKSYFFEAENFLLKKQEFNQPTQDRKLQISYPEYQKLSDKIVPLNFSIEAQQKKGKTNIDIDYKNITFNEEFSFPYSVPDGYERIYIN
ncbi:DUF4292 domain-containing protein [Flavobacterium sp.]|uniref:DUF4292 domain-containing protein n=1 Tax=Flavobacterium sp. TaxID=239 RepID=UPI00261940B7|nr:DUF4292 domain-containing protein [Flavobacterium sp.]